MSHYRPYPAYKESGVEWLGRVPAHWDVLRLGQLGAFSKGSGGTKQDEQPTGVPCIRYSDLYTTHRHFIVNSRSCISPERAVDYTTIAYGDVLFAASGETLEEIGKSAVNLLDSEVCCGGDVIIYRPTASVDPRFLGYAADCQSAAFQKAGMGRGFTVAHIYPSQLKNLLIAFPPLEEQHAISASLDRETARIDALIEKKQRLIELLKEKRQAVITQAVTKGLDPDVPMKDSGVEWLGEVPEHWDVGKLRWQANLQGGVAKGRDLSSAHTKVLPYLRVANVQDGYLDLDEVKEIDLLVSKVQRYLLKTGDVLMNEGGDNDKLGRGTVWDGAIAPCVHQNHVFAVRPSAHLCPEWLALFTASSGAKSYFFLRSKQSTNLASISASNVKEIHVPLPPTDEQRSICRSVGEMTWRFDQLIQKTQRSMDLLAEHRSALITAAVTGQIDVRDAA